MNIKIGYRGNIKVILFSVILTSCAQPNVDKALDKITDQGLRNHIIRISDDITAGRAPGSEGSIIAQRYIADQMKQTGLKPGSEDSGFYQRIDMVKIVVEPTMKLNFVCNNDIIEPVYYTDYIIFPGTQKEHISIEEAGLLFVGYGIQAPEYSWDDFKGVDVSGKFLLIMNNDPDTGDVDFFSGQGRTYYGRWSYKYEQAARMGALGAIIIHTTPSAGYPWQVVQTSWSGPQFELMQQEESNLACKAWVTDTIASQIAEMAGYKLSDLLNMAQKPDFKPVSLNITVNCNINSKIEQITGANIAGLLPGSDPELCNQAIVVTAHHDHLGIGKVINGDSIYNGAVDNASGVASILTLAEAFSSLKKAPRRTLVFVAVDGEESGLLGSEYFAQHPTFPAEMIAANVNIDFVNIWGKTQDVVIIGYGKSTLDEIVRKYAEKQGRIVVPDATPELGMFYRSDQYSFAKIGVPGLYISTGLGFIGKPAGWGKETTDNWIRTHYHQPSDEYDPNWDLSGHIEDMELLFHVILDLANRDDMPEWLPGDEFEKIRQGLGN
ncbi:MAG: M28 family peptidase [Bacteroidales bacterium]|nr:M28 family peptidase [Bacteroidales bacterium]MBN2762363.1 M28 family peptidase [Bacteroidales bacterium]